jgi:hypothetical protein
LQSTEYQNHLALNAAGIAIAPLYEC